MINGKYQEKETDIICSNGTLKYWIKCW